MWIFTDHGLWFCKEGAGSDVHALWQWVIFPRDTYVRRTPSVCSLVTYHRRLPDPSSRISQSRNYPVDGTWEGGRLVGFRRVAVRDALWISVGPFPDPDRHPPCPTFSNTDKPSILSAPVPLTGRSTTTTPSGSTKRSSPVDSPSLPTSTTWPVI